MSHVPGTRVVVDALENVFFSGYTSPLWSGPGKQPARHKASGAADLATGIVKLGANGLYQWHTFYGGFEDSLATGMVVTDDNHLIVCGYSDGSWYGPGGETPLHGHAPGNETTTTTKTPS